MRCVVLFALFTSSAIAAPVHLVQQGRLLDPTGAPIDGDRALRVDLCPNEAATPGETCHSEVFDPVAFDDGYFAVVLGSEQTLDHSVFDAPDVWAAFTVDGSTLGARQRVGQFIPRQGGMLLLGSAADSDCADATNEGAMIYRNGAVQVCTNAGWRSLAYGETVVQSNGARQWSDGSFASSCADYIRPASPDRLYLGAVGDGAYRIDPDGLGGNEPFVAYCDMTSEEGGFTLVMNLDTADGHTMWWGNELWTNGGTRGTADDNPFDGDLVSPAYSQMNGVGEVRIVVHEQGAVRGFKRWNKPNTAALGDYVLGADNTVMGSAVASSEVSNLSNSEFLVRTTTVLYANHCVNGTCVTDTGGSPDGQRIGSNQAAPTNNNGGGLGNWSDMNYCCDRASWAGHTCNGQSFRTASEAQGGWFPGYNGGSHNTGTFGTDTLFPFNPTSANSSCTQTNWAQTNGIQYDYAIYVR